MRYEVFQKALLENYAMSARI